MNKACYNRKISDQHLVKIATSSHCSKWRFLPPFLDLDSGVTDIIDRKQVDEVEKKLEFLREWQKRKGSGATYRALIDALGKIDCQADAEFVEDLVQPQAAAAALSSASTQTDQATNGSTEVPKVVPPSEDGSSNLQESKTSLSALQPPSEKVKRNLRLQLKRNRDEIGYQYAAYVDFICTSLQDRGITTKNLATFLLKLPALKVDTDDEDHKLFAGLRTELRNAETINDIVDLLDEERTSILDYGVYQAIVKRYKIDLNQSEENKEILRYPEYVKSYVEKHKLSEFMKINPELSKLSVGSEELVLKFDIKLATYRLASLLELESIITDILGLEAFTLRFLRIEEGCVVVTFLIPSPVAHYIFPDDKVLTIQQIRRFRGLSALWLKCCGHYISFKRDESDESWSSELVLAEAMEKCSSINDMAMINGKQVSQLMAACYHGNPDYVQALLKAPEIKIDLQNDEGFHALVCACEQGNTKVVQLVLDAFPNPQQLLDLAQIEGVTPIMLASQNGHLETVSLLLQKGASVNLQENDGWSPLMAASQGGHTDVVSLLIQHGAHVNMQRNDGWSALMMASENGHRETVAVLLNKGADINMQDNDESSSLMIASQNGHTEIALCLVQNGAYVDIQEKDGWSALMMACMNGHLAVVSVLIEHGANIDMKKEDGWFSLMLACIIGHTEMVSLLLQKGASIDMRNSKGWSSLMIASENGHTETVLVLLQNGADINMQAISGWTSLMIASQNGHVDTVLLLLQNGATVDTRRPDGVSSLMIASQNGHVSVVSLLLQHGANADVQKSDGGWSSLIIASLNGHTEVVSLLVQNGADVNLQENSGLSSLMTASQNGHLEIAVLLVRNDAHVNMLNNDGWSSLMLASQNGHTEVASLLIQNSADVDMQEKDGWSSLMLSSQNGYIKMVSLLLQHGAHVNLRNKDKMSSLMIASRYGHTDILSLLLQHDAITDIQNNDGCSALMIAILSDRTQAALCLIEAGANLTLVNNMKESALTLAAKNKQPSVVQKILKSVPHHKVVDHTNALGESPLMIASFHGDVAIAKMLLKAGAKVDVSNFSDYSSLHLPLQHTTSDDKQAEKITGNELFTSGILANLKLISEVSSEYVVDSQLHHQNKHYSSQVEEGIRGSALDIAVIRGDFVMVSLLLSYNAKVFNVYRLFRSVILKIANERKKERSTMINSSIFSASSEEQETGVPVTPSLWEKYSIVFTLLFSHYSDLIERVQCTKPSTLYIACSYGVLEVVRFLLQLEVDPSDLYRTDSSGLSYWSSLISIICSGSSLLSSTSKEGSSEVLHQAHWSKILSALIVYGLNINHSDLLGNFALKIASREGHKALVMYLLRRGATVNQQDKDGVSSLMLACAEGYTSISRLLLGHEAMVDLRDKKGWSALMFAASGGYVDLVVHLLGKGALIDLQDVSGTSPLMLSCFAGHVPVTRALLVHKADINLQNNEGITALMMASYNGHREIAGLLLRHGADRSIVTNVGLTALDFSKNEELSTLLGEQESAITKSAIRDLQDKEIEEQLQQIVMAFSPGQSSRFEPNIKPEMGEAYSLFQDFAYNWEAIGTVLKFSSHEIEEIRFNFQNKPDVCFRELLYRWLKRAFPAPTWAELKEAVEISTYGNVVIPIKKTGVDTPSSSQGTQFEDLAAKPHGTKRKNSQSHDLPFDALSSDEKKAKMGPSSSSLTMPSIVSSLSGYSEEMDASKKNKPGVPSSMSPEPSNFPTSTCFHTSKGSFSGHPMTTVITPWTETATAGELDLDIPDHDNPASTATAAAAADSSSGAPVPPPATDSTTSKVREVRG